MKKRIISILLVLAMLLCALPLSVSADEPEMVYITVSDDSAFVTTVDGQPLAYWGVEISELTTIDLSEYSLDEYIYDADMDGTPEITALHLYIYIHEVVLGLDWSDVTVTGSAGSIYFAGGLFGFSDENLRYDLNGAYPNVDGWGTTADRIVLAAGDFLNVAHYTDWAFWGDSATGFHYFADEEGSIVLDYKATVGEDCSIKLIRSFSDWSNGGLPAFVDEPYFTVYYGPSYGDATGTVETDDYGCAVIDFPEAGKWYVWTDGGYGMENDYAIVSAPAFATVNVKEKEEADAPLSFLQAPSLSFQDYIGMQVIISSSLAEQYDNIYVEAVQATPEGNVTTILEGIPYLDDFLLFDQQILSWSMTETVTLTLCAEKDGVPFVGQSYTASVESLALAMLPKNADNATVCRVLVDMLNYGAAVQTAFDYNAANLPNTNLGEYADMGTLTIPDLNATNSYEGTGSVTVLQTSISMQSKVEIQLAFSGDISAYTPKATIGNNELTCVVDAETFADYGLTVVRIAIPASNMRDFVTFALYEGDAPVTAVQFLSVEALVKNMTTSARSSVIIAMMRYGDSVAAL